MISLCAVLVSTPQARSPDHRLEQVPGVVAAQRQQALVDRGEGDVRAGRGLAALHHLDLRHRRLAHGVLRLVGRDAHLQLVRGEPDLQLGDAELERRLGEIDHRRRRLPVLAVAAKAPPPLDRRLPAPGEERVPGRLADPAAQGEDADIDVRPPARLDLQLDRRIVAAQDRHLGRDHALALDRDQRGRLAERHAHLQPRDLARLVALLLGQDVDPVVVVLREPELALLRDPDRRRGGGRMVLPHPSPRRSAPPGRRRRAWLAEQQAAVVGRARAQRAELLDLGAVVVGVEAADHALAGGDDLADPALDGNALPLDRLARGVEREHGELGAAAIARPRAGAHAEHHRARPEVDPGGDGLGLAVRIGEADLGVDLARPHHRRQVLEREARGAVAVGREGQLVGDELAVARAAVASPRSRSLPARPSSDRAAARTRTRRSRRSSGCGSSAGPRRAAPRRSSARPRSSSSARRRRRSPARPAPPSARTGARPPAAGGTPRPGSCRCGQLRCRASPSLLAAGRAWLRPLPAVRARPRRRRAWPRAECSRWWRRCGRRRSTAAGT